jgi:D-alanyl-lipoteichoic acid acyltransferase DltB (MBOAT superfamily)
VWLARLFLAIASIAFYSYWNLIYILRLILLSLIFNYFLGKELAMPEEKRFVRRISKRMLLISGVAINLAALGYFKYTDFFIENINFLFGSSLPFLHILLPIGVSFFTFQEIAYLVDSYRGKTKEYSFLNYALFVTFFPQLIAGPIVHHSEMMPQFDKKEGFILNYDNIARGFFLLLIGLTKKVVFADSFAAWATNIFDHAIAPTFFEAWTGSLAYTLQLYFDFSGYTDMALGSALMFNIIVPINFNSPYKALDIQDFWKRWHMTLSRFLKDYLYIPLGGNRKGTLLTYRNLFIVFLLGGLWHGAAWTFVVWGALHGIATMIFYLWRKLGITLPRILAWMLTFNFVNVAWVFFRARTFSDAWKILRGMAGINGITILDAQSALDPGALNGYKSALWITGIMLLFVLFTKNSVELSRKFKPTLIMLFVLVFLFLFPLWHINNYSEFIYFQF